MIPRASVWSRPLNRGACGSGSQFENHSLSSVAAFERCHVTNSARKVRNGKISSTSRTVCHLQRRPLGCTRATPPSRITPMYLPFDFSALRVLRLLLMGTRARLISQPPHPRSCTTIWFSLSHITNSPHLRSSDAHARRAQQQRARSTD